jgi:hypothetical protein
MPFLTSRNARSVFSNAATTNERMNDRQTERKEGRKIMPGNNHHETGIPLVGELINMGIFAQPLQTVH